MHGISIFVCFYSRMIYIKNKLYPCSDDVSETTISCIPKLVVPCSKLGQSRVYKVFFIAKIKLPCPFLNGGVSLKNQLIVSNIHCHYFLIILCDSMTRAYNARNMYFLRAQRASEASSQESFMLSRGVWKQWHISKTKHFSTMVHRRKNYCFHPLNPYPWWTDPTRP